MSYWKSKVAPKLKKLFDTGGKKKGAANACKLFDSSKESLEKEIGEKTTDLNPKVVEIYRSSTFVSKKLLKEPSESAVKEHPDEAQALLQELTKAEFPGAKTLSDAGKKYGPALITGPIVYLFGKTSTFLVEEPLPEPPQETREITIEPSSEEKATEPEGEVVNPPHPAPASHVEEESGAPSEEKKEVTPFLESKKDELITAVEDKTKEVTHPGVKEAEVNPLEAKKEEAAPPSKEEKKEEAAATPSEGTKEKASALVEGKKEEVKSALAGKEDELKGKKEEVKGTLEGKKEEVKSTLEGKKEEVKSVLGTEEKEGETDLKL